MRYELGSRKIDLRGEQYFIAPNATVIGSVVIENQVSIWFNAVLRADNDVIHLGAETNIQDGAILHTDVGIPLQLGQGVTVGHKAMLHGCEVGEYSLIGINAVILNRAKIGRYCLIGANTLIPEGKEIPDYSVVMGSPGKVVKTVSEAQMNLLKLSAAHYVEKIQQYKNQLKEDNYFPRSIS